MMMDVSHYIKSGSIFWLFLEANTVEAQSSVEVRVTDLYIAARWAGSVAVLSLGQLEGRVLLWCNVEGCEVPEHFGSTSVLELCAWERRKERSDKTWNCVVLLTVNSLERRGRW